MTMTKAAMRREAADRRDANGGMPMVNGRGAQILFEAITSPAHKVDLTLPKTKSPDAAERATWRR